MGQKIAQLEKELAEKELKWKATAGQKEAELVKKLADYKEKVSSISFAYVHECGLKKFKKSR